MAGVRRWPDGFYKGQGMLNPRRYDMYYMTVERYIVFFLLTSPNPSINYRNSKDDGSIILLDPRRALQRLHVQAGQRPLPRERAHLFLQRDDALRSLALAGRRDAHEVFEQLRARLLLENEGELHGAVEELGDDFVVGFEHVAGGQRRCAEADAAGDLSGS